jgi:hypothetical protein
MIPERRGWECSDNCPGFLPTAPLHDVWAYQWDMKISVTANDLNDGSLVAGPWASVALIVSMIPERRGWESTATLGDWSKYMPEESPKVAVDSHPRLSGIMDTINATDAHGPRGCSSTPFVQSRSLHSNH